MFPNVPAIMAKLDIANVTYSIGGSVALYTQGASRIPHDVDIMFLDKEHEVANRTFGINSEIIERSNVSMNKSTPVSDGSVDFLSDFTVIANGRSYTNPAEHTQRVFVEFKGKRTGLVPAEKIAVFKLIGQREHHNDSLDVKELLHHPNFNRTLFWEFVDILDAQEIVNKRLSDQNSN